MKQKMYQLTRALRGSRVSEGESISKLEVLRCDIGWWSSKLQFPSLRLKRLRSAVADHFKLGTRSFHPPVQMQRVLLTPSNFYKSALLKL
jgi:hypothetical protein